MSKINKKKFSKSYVVCTCRQVTLGEIIHAIKENGARNLDDVERLTEAGSSCGCCKSAEDDYAEKKMKLYTSQILEKFAK